MWTANRPRAAPAYLRYFPYPRVLLRSRWVHPFSGGFFRGTPWLPSPGTWGDDVRRLCIVPQGSCPKILRGSDFNAGCHHQGCRGMSQDMRSIPRFMTSHVTHGIPALAHITYRLAGKMHDMDDTFGQILTAPIPQVSQQSVMMRHGGCRFLLGASSGGGE